MAEACLRLLDTLRPGEANRDNDFVKSAGALAPGSVRTEQNIISSVTKYLFSAELMSREKESVTEK